MPGLMDGNTRVMVTGAQAAGLYADAETCELRQGSLVFPSNPKGSLWCPPDISHGCPPL